MNSMKKITQKEIADKVGISVVSLNRIVRGHYIPKIEMAKKIVKASGGRYKLTDLIPGLKNILEDVL